MKKLLPLILLTSACTVDSPEVIVTSFEEINVVEETVEEVIKVNPVEVDYNISSHDYKHTVQPIVDFANILFDLGYDTQTVTHTNTSLAIADFNRDGEFDLYFHNNLGADEDPVDPEILVFDKETGKYTPSYDLEFITKDNILHSRKTIVGDFNLDGYPDVVRPAGAHDQLGKSNITLSNSNGYEILYLNTIPESDYHTLSSGDIDNDGDLDLFFAGSYRDGFGINNGKGEFTWVRSYELIEGFKVDDSIDGDHGKYGVGTSEMTDVNNDGYIDIILAGNYDFNWIDNLDGVTIIYGDGSGRFNYHERRVFEMDTTITGTTDIALVDINNDGIKDLFTKSGTIDEEVLIEAFVSNEEGYERLPMEANRVANVKGVVWITVRDIDGDGKIEITEQESSIYEYTGNVRKALEWEFNGEKFVRSW